MVKKSLKKISLEKMHVGEEQPSKEFNPTNEVNSTKNFNPSKEFNSTKESNPTKDYKHPPEPKSHKQGWPVRPVQIRPSVRHGDQHKYSCLSAMETSTNAAVSFLKQLNRVFSMINCNFITNNHNFLNDGYYRILQ